MKQSKYDDSCDEVELIDSNLTYDKVRQQNVFAKTVPLRDLAPLPNPSKDCSPPTIEYTLSIVNFTPPIAASTPTVPRTDAVYFSESAVTDPHPPSATSTDTGCFSEKPTRMSQRHSKPPERLNYEKLGGG